MAGSPGRRTKSRNGSAIDGQSYVVSETSADEHASISKGQGTALPNADAILDFLPKTYQDWKN